MCDEEEEHTQEDYDDEYADSKRDEIINRFYSHRCPVCMEECHWSKDKGHYCRHGHTFDKTTCEAERRGISASEYIMHGGR